MEKILVQQEWRNESRLKQGGIGWKMQQCKIDLGEKKKHTGWEWEEILVKEEMARKEARKRTEYKEEQEWHLSSNRE